MDSKSVVEMVIFEVRNRPVLWDKKHELHKNRMYVDKVWEEVAEAVNKNKDEVKMKWRNLRDQFSRELKKNPVSEDGNPIVEKYNGKWVYYDLLTFLKNDVYLNPSEELTMDDFIITDLKSDSDLKVASDINIIIKRDPDLDDIEKEIEGDRFLDPLSQEDNSDSNLVPTESNEIPRKRLCQRKLKTSYVQRQMGMHSDILHTARTSGKDIDDDLHFALSLVPYLRRLDPLRKLIIRNEMQNLLIGELIGEPNSGPYTSKSNK